MNYKIKKMNCKIKILTASIFGMSFVGTLGAVTTNVSTVAEIRAALENYSNGDVVIVEPGTYDFTGITNYVGSGTQDNETRYYSAHFKTVWKKALTLRGNVSGHWGAGERVVFTGDCRFLNQTGGGRWRLENIVFEGFNGGTWRSGSDSNNRGGVVNSKTIDYSNPDYEYVTASNCVFKGNKAYAGGAFCGGEVIDCLFVGNESLYDGRGGATCNTRMEGCTFSNNTSVAGCGVAYGHKGMSGCAFVGNRALNGDGGVTTDATSYGGVSNCVFIANSATKAGGALAGDTVSVFDCVFLTNSAPKGGAIWTKSLTAQGCRFVANTTTGNGGACIVEPGAESLASTMSRCALADNRAEYGGAVYGPVALESCGLTNNFARRDGAGLYKGTACDSSFAGNVLYDSYHYFGGDGYQSTFVDCTFSGGNIYRSSLTRCRIVGVTNEDNRCVFSAENWMTNCLIANCECREIFYRYSEGTDTNKGSCVNCTFADNKVEALMQNAYGLTNAYSFVNCIFNGNTKNGTPIDLSTKSEKGEGGVLVNTGSLRCCLYGVKAQSFPIVDLGGNKVGDAKFAREQYVEKIPGAEYYMIRRASSAYGSGDLLDWTASDTDLVGESRVRNGTVSMGCYESDLALGLVLIVR